MEKAPALLRLALREHADAPTARRLEEHIGTPKARCHDRKHTHKHCKDQYDPTNDPGERARLLNTNGMCNTYTIM